MIQCLPGGSDVGVQPWDRVGLERVNYIVDAHQDAILALLAYISSKNVG